MTAEALQFFTPVVGRMTHGSVTEKRTKDYEGRDIEPENQRFEIGVAFEKQAIWPMLAEQWYPYLAGALANDQNAMQRMQNWFSTASGFSMKVTDGDKPNAKGQTNDNTKGCFVLWFNFIEPKCCAGPDQDHLVEIDPSEVKRGYYVQVAGNLKPNGLQGERAGIYLNGNVVWLRATGEIIAGGMDPSAAFAGAAPAALPSGAQQYDPSKGAAGAFQPQGMPGNVPGSAPAQPQTAPASMPGAAPYGMPGSAPQQTASPSEPQTTPHTGILSGPPGMPPR